MIKNIANDYFHHLEFLSKEAEFLTENNLVKLTTNNDLIIEVPYASSNNFCNQQLYSHPFVYLHHDAFNALQKAIEEAKKLGYKIKIWDGFRPFECQAFMADEFPNYVENGYVSHSVDGIATHVRGIAVDLTLIDQNYQELDMGTFFDEMIEQANLYSPKISKEQTANRKILSEIMIKSGFEIYDFEWWHYNLKIFARNQQNQICGAIEQQAKKYPKITKKFPELLSEKVKNKYKQ